MPSFNKTRKAKTQGAQTLISLFNHNLRKTKKARTDKINKYKKHWDKTLDKVLDMQDTISLMENSKKKKVLENNVKKLMKTFNKIDERLSKLKPIKMKPMSLGGKTTKKE